MRYAATRTLSVEAIQESVTDVAVSPDAASPPGVVGAVVSVLWRCHLNWASAFCGTSKTADTATARSRSGRIQPPERNGDVVDVVGGRSRADIGAVGIDGGPLPAADANVREARLDVREVEEHHAIHPEFDRAGEVGRRRE